jgi:hypothetical protein
MNILQIGNFPNPSSDFLMYKASIELYMKAMDENEIKDMYEMNFNNAYLSDNCRT